MLVNLLIAGVVGHIFRGMAASAGGLIAQVQAKHYSDVPEYVKMAEATWYAGLRKAGIPER
jgi:hypothetical protein